jgi:nicotinate-nucleotide adenylyltransferase
MGADQALQFATWREPQRVLELAALAIAERDGVAMEDVRSALAAVGDARVEQFAMPRIDVSSTDVRRRVAAGRPYEFLVPERVAARIEQRGLYR